MLNRLNLKKLGLKHQYRMFVVSKLILNLFLTVNLESSDQALSRHASVANLTSKPIHPRLLKSMSAAVFGVKGYEMPKFGLPTDQPKYTFKKDNKQSYLNFIKVQAGAAPCCTKYSQRPSWQTASGYFGKSKKKRKTFTDEASLHSK